MKAKTIKSVLCKKFRAWLESIEDEPLRQLAAENSIITGGSIASMLIGEKVNDYDLYFRTKEVAEKMAKYYVDQFKKNPTPKFAGGGEVTITVWVTEDRVKIVVKSAGIAGEEANDNYKYFEQIQDPESIDAAEYVEDVTKAVDDAKDKTKKPFRPIFLSTNAITLADDIQIVIRFWGEPDQIHENYDFIHCTNYWTSWDNHLELRPKALEALLARELRYVGSKYPVCSLIRTRKFIKRQWVINAGQFLKMVMQVNDLDLTNLSVLEDQLTGVDAAYFEQLVQALRERDPERVDKAYLVEIIDRIF